MSVEPVTRQWVRDLPKAQTHVHLEGSIPLGVLRPAALAAGDTALAAGPPPMSGGLGPFLGYLDRACALITTAAQLGAIAEHVAHTAAAQGIVYTEAIVNPTHWPAWSDRLTDFVDALDRGFARAEAAGAPRTMLSLSASRTQGADEATALVRWIAATRHPRVIALSIDGNEAASGRTGERFGPAFTLARELGIHRTVHAGESSGPEGVIDALDLLHAERIDHGIRAVEDNALVQRLVAEAVPLGVCLTSNVTLGVIGTLLGHPARALFEYGVRISLNTDDPELVHCTLDGEYLQAARTFGWGRAELVTLARNSVEGSFASDEAKRGMLAALNAYAG
jgi:adenosine deaminase